MALYQSNMRLCRAGQKPAFTGRAKAGRLAKRSSLSSEVRFGFSSFYSKNRLQ
jgi:hypothetical protein